MNVPDRIAAALAASDWSDVPLGNKAIILAAIDALGTASRAREALAPFAVLGGLLNIAGKAALPDDVSALRLKLDGLKAAHFRAAHAAFIGKAAT